MPTERIACSEVKQSRYRTLFIPREGRENIDKNQEKTEKQVRESIMQGESISIPNVHGTPWESFQMFLLRWML